MRKPAWLHKKISLSAARPLKQLLRSNNLHTVCEEASCPNLSECFSCGIATFMILGNVCTRSCTFCGLEKGLPALVDEHESQRIVQAIERLGLRYAVITSPTRDDLADGGAQAFCTITGALKRLPQPPVIELLIPDFFAAQDAIERVAVSGADVIGHNIETVPAIYAAVRKGADYQRSLQVLTLLKRYNSTIRVKTGIMLGLGERTVEVMRVMRDVRACGCDTITLGQYLAPSKKHYPVQEYIHPTVFEQYKEAALAMGFVNVQSAPYVRSSYQAAGL